MREWRVFPAFAVCMIPCYYFLVAHLLMNPRLRRPNDVLAAGDLAPASLQSSGSTYVARESGVMKSLVKLITLQPR